MSGLWNEQTKEHLPPQHHLLRAPLYLRVSSADQELCEFGADGEPSYKSAHVFQRAKIHPSFVSSSHTSLQLFVSPPLPLPSAALSDASVNLPYLRRLII